MTEVGDFFFFFTKDNFFYDKFKLVVMI